MTARTNCQGETHLPTPGSAPSAHAETNANRARAPARAPSPRPGGPQQETSCRSTSSPSAGTCRPGRLRPSWPSPWTRTTTTPTRRPTDPVGFRARMSGPQRDLIHHNHRSDFVLSRHFRARYLGTELARAQPLVISAAGARCVTSVPYAAYIRATSTAATTVTAAIATMTARPVGDVSRPVAPSHSAAPRQSSDSGRRAPGKAAWATALLPRSSTPR